MRAFLLYCVATVGVIGNEFSKLSSQQQLDLESLHLLQLHADRGHSKVAKTKDPGEDAVKFCNSEELTMSEPTVNNLDGSADGPKMILYPSVKEGVDLMVTADDNYVAKDASQNGFNGGFGNLNMKTGTATNLKFTFVQTGTTNPVVVPQFSFSFFDMDEGKKGKARGNVESCGVAASFVPSSTELAQQFKGDCVKTTTCKRGAKNNEPPNPFALTDDHLNRAMTMSYEGQSSATVRLSLGKGKGGRNFMFSLTAANACAKTTTTTTSPIPTTQPVPHCPKPNGTYRFCNGHDDPMIERTFLPGRGGVKGWNDRGYHAHMGLGIFWAARTKNGDGVQVFQTPLQTVGVKDGWQMSSIGGVAVKIGNDIITYTPTTFHNNSGTVKVKVNGREYKATDVQEKTPSGFVTSIPKNGPEHKIAWDQADIDGLCVTDDARTMQLKLAKRKGYKVGVEFQFALSMNEDIFDTTNSGAFGPGGKYGGGYGQICMDGGAGYLGAGFQWKQINPWSPWRAQSEVEAAVHDSQRVAYDDSWFGAQELGEMCDNMMSFHAYGRMEDWQDRDENKTDLGHVGGCHELANSAAEKNAQSPHSPQELCEALNVSYEDAQATCANVEKPTFKEACLLEYCNDFGDVNAKQIAEEVEDDIEAAQASADESHHNELNFTPEECCVDDLNCDKGFSLA